MDWLHRNLVPGVPAISMLSAKFKPPVVVLVSEQTASAAEILAHVMQFIGRATIVGRTTAGAVLNSSKFKLPGGGNDDGAHAHRAGCQGREGPRSRRRPGIHRSDPAAGRGIAAGHFCCSSFWTSHRAISTIFSDVPAACGSSRYLPLMMSVGVLSA